MQLPKDPVILLSYINTQLRDFYPSLDELCKSLCIEEYKAIWKSWARNVYVGIKGYNWQCSNIIIY